MTIGLVPVVLAVAGALVYGLASGKPADLGRDCFRAGVLVAAYVFATHSIHC